MATLVAALHVAVLARRVSARWPVHSPTAAWAWRSDGGPVAPQSCEPERPPSHPSGHFSAGLLPLEAGVAVVARTRWLHIMRISSPIGV